MKNILLLSLVVLLVSPIFAQSNAPKKIRKAFELMVPDAQDVKWSTSKERQTAKERKYTVDYKINNDSIFSRFDYKANWVITVTYIEVEQLPKAVSSTIYDDYMSAEITKAARVEQPDFDGYGAIFTYMGDQWTVQVTEKGRIVLRSVTASGF